MLSTKVFEFRKNKYVEYVFRPNQNKYNNTKLKIDIKMFNVQEILNI